VIEDGGFAGLDALRMSLKAQTGISFMRNKRAKKTPLMAWAEPREVKSSGGASRGRGRTKQGKLVEETVDV